MGIGGSPLNNNECFSSSGIKSPAASSRRSARSSQSNASLLIKYRYRLPFHISLGVSHRDIVFNKEGKEIKKQNPKEIVPNVRDDTPPLKWTGKFFKRDDILKKFVITKSIQLRHVDGLTFEFLYGMAKTLNDKKSLMFIGGGKSGKDPLIFQTNGNPYRGFLDGRVNKNQYQLILRLSNMELRK